MDFINKLKVSAEKSGSVLCMGLDPVPDYLPGEGLETGERLTSFFETILSGLIRKNVMPGAFKPNLGFFSCLDRPRQGRFSGSLALAKILAMIGESFPDIPVILDYKRGDIARSSENYAIEGFVSWGCDSVTVSPYMGSDSVEPFLKEAVSRGGGAYVLDRTSNPGGKEVQNLQLANGGENLFTAVGKKIISWARMYPGTGAVTGATSPQELKNLALLFRGRNIPLLIPGVGSQGGSFSDVAGIMKEAQYETPLIRINVSSAITHPWVKNKKGVPRNWGEVCVDAFLKFNEEAGGLL